MAFCLASWLNIYLTYEEKFPKNQNCKYWQWLIVILNQHFGFGMQT